jgi:hypothetical protein
MGMGVGWGERFLRTPTCHAYVNCHVFVHIKSKTSVLFQIFH